MDFCGQLSCLGPYRPSPALNPASHPDRPIYKLPDKSSSRVTTPALQESLTAVSELMSFKVLVRVVFLCAPRFISGDGLESDNLSSSRSSLHAASFYGLIYLSSIFHIQSAPPHNALLSPPLFFCRRRTLPRAVFSQPAQIIDDQIILLSVL